MAMKCYPYKPIMAYTATPRITRSSDDLFTFNKRVLKNMWTVLLCMCEHYVCLIEFGEESKQNEILEYLSLV